MLDHAKTAILPKDFGATSIEELIAQRYPPRADVDLDALADMAATIVDGGITLTKTLKDSSLLPKQVALFRTFVRTIFAPP